MIKKVPGYLLFFLIFLNITASAQFPYTETYKNATAPNTVFGGGAPAFLTAGKIGIPGPGTSKYNDTEGNGYLRLTDNNTFQKGYIYNETSFPSSNGLKVEFEYFTYGGTGADGISFFLFDATANPFVIGGFGGSLGYSQINIPEGTSPGVSKGYLAVGIDEYGYFSNPIEGRQGGVGFKPGSVTLRGKGDGMNFNDPNNYKYLTSIQTLQEMGFELTPSGNTREESPNNANYRKVTMELKPAAVGYDITVKITTGGPNPVTRTVIDNFPYHEAAPANLRYGLAGSTGTATNFHEIRNVRIDKYINTTPQTPKIGLTKVLSSRIANPDGSYDVKFTFKVSNHGLVNMNKISLTDDLENVFNGTTFSVISKNITEGNTLVINPDYNGASDKQLLNQQSTLAAGQSGSLELTLKITPATKEGIFLNTALAQGNSVTDGALATKESSNSLNAGPDLTPSPTPVELNKVTVPAPKIGLTKVLSNLTPGTNGSFNVRFSFIVSNHGLTDMDKISVTDDLERVFSGTEFNVVSKSIISGSTLIINQGFNGKSDKELLNPQSTLAAGTNGSIDIELQITPVTQEGIFLNTALAKGTSVLDGTVAIKESSNSINPGPDLTPSPTPVELKKSNIFIPNGFSPNNDGVNDKFVIRNNTNKKVSIEIFNRWANRVYKNQDYDNSWDGRCTEGIYVGTDVPPGTYYYVVKIDQDKYAGYITINR